MAFQLQCNVYFDYDEIVIEDSSGYAGASTGSAGYSDTGWSQADITTVSSISLTIGGNTIVVDSSTNTDLLPFGIWGITYPNDLVFTINSDTYSTFDTTFGSLSDGAIDIEYSVTYGSTTETYTTQVFRYRTIEEKVWDLYHQIAYDNKAYDRNDYYIDNTLFCYSLLKSLEYCARTSLDFNKAEEILTLLENIINTNIYNTE